jgi:hypothetical protein
VHVLVLSVHALFVWERCPHHVGLAGLAPGAPSHCKGGCRAVRTGGPPKTSRAARAVFVFWGCPAFCNGTGPLRGGRCSARPGGSEWGSVDGLTLRPSVPGWMRLEKSPSPTGSLPPSALWASGSLYLSSPLERRRGRGQGCSGVRPMAIAAAVGTEPEFRLYWHLECRCFVHYGCRGLNMYVFSAWSRVFPSFRALRLACRLSELLHRA